MVQFESQDGDRHIIHTFRFKHIMCDTGRSTFIYFIYPMLCIQVTQSRTSLQHKLHMSISPWLRRHRSGAVGGDWEFGADALRGATAAWNGHQLSAAGASNPNTQRLPASRGPTVGRWTWEMWQLFWDGCWVRKFLESFSNLTTVLLFLQYLWR